MVIAFLGLGSNIQPQINLPRAVRMLRARCNFQAVSSVWQSPPVNSAGPIFLNAVLAMRTPLSPETLKQQVLRPLEAELGRVRGTDKHAPRPIDIDILLYDGKILDAGIWQYAHIALPLAELLPDLRHPGSRERLLDAARRLQLQTDIQRRKDVRL